MHYSGYRPFSLAEHLHCTKSLRAKIPPDPRFIGEVYMEHGFEWYGKSSFIFLQAFHSSMEIQIPNTKSPSDAIQTATSLHYAHDCWTVFHMFF